MAKAPPLRKAAPAVGAFAKHKPVFTPPKIVIVGVEGFGKTTIGASVEGAVMLMPNKETGYKTLVGAGRVPNIPYLITNTWEETMAALDDMGGAKALVLDELTGFEAQCNEYVCRVTKEFSSDWYKFNHYLKGEHLVANGEWARFLVRLEQLGILVVALSHFVIAKYPQLDTEGFSRYSSGLGQKYVWPVTRQWADAILYGSFEIARSDDGRGLGGKERILHTEHDAIRDGKNRYGMPPVMRMPDEPAEMWPTIWDAINGA